MSTNQMGMRSTFVGGPWAGQMKRLEVREVWYVPMPVPVSINEPYQASVVLPQEGEYRLRADGLNFDGTLLVYDWVGPDELSREAYKGLAPADSRSTSQPLGLQNLVFQNNATPVSIGGMIHHIGAYANHVAMYWASPVSGSLLFGDDPAIEMEPVEPPELPEEEVAEALVCYRGWDLDEDHLDVGNYLMTSVTANVQWDGPILRADGEPSSYSPHDWRWAGRSDLCYGIYAWLEPAWEDYSWAGLDVWGRVEATGKCVIHETGLRAEAVRIEALVVNQKYMKYHGIVEQLSDKYQCEVSFDPRHLEVGQ